MDVMNKIERIVVTDPKKFAISLNIILISGKFYLKCMVTFLKVRFGAMEKFNNFKVIVRRYSQHRTKSNIGWHVGVMP